VDAGYISKEGIGYIKLNKYSKTTMEELNEVFNSFQKAKVNKIILDLTDNTGGYLDQSIQLVDEFMSDKQMIVYTEGVNSPRQEYRATSKGRFDKCKLVIVVDEGSASASEITAGAVQDWDRGVIIGRRTFGKGLVQRPFMLPDGSMIRLTVARYYTPSGRTIQKPYSDDFEEYSLDIVNRYRHGEFTNQDSISFPDSLKHETLINQRTVYGGGGIMPDIFIPIDTVLYGEFHYAMLRKGLMFRFVNKYIDDNREKLLKNYAEIATFESDFTINDEVLAQLYEFGRNNNIDVDTFALPSNIQQQRLKVHIKALMAGELWKTNEFYRIFNEINPNYIEAKAVLLDNKKYESLLKKK
ncbi:MAG TPA: S41 family peptidase, partial [Bacteroidales bacterium]|nr:S41 family peptidase [Bacteroidales bacterium]